MKISLAQTRSFKGKIEQNIIHHKKFISVAASRQADLVIFPELSITGYEPSLASELATTKEDIRFNELQAISNDRKIVVGIGVPTAQPEGACISLVLFQPFKEKIVYSKKHLHVDEEPFFISGENFPVLQMNSLNIGLAICYEISVPEHAEEAFINKAGIYIASAAKTGAGTLKAYQTLPGIAQKYQVPVLYVNSIGPSDNFTAAGQSAVWDKHGNLLGQLDDISEGILMYDTETDTISKTILQ